MVRDGAQWNFRKLILAIQSDPFCGHTSSTHLVDKTLGDFKNI